MQQGTQMTLSLDGTAGAYPSDEEILGMDDARAEAEHTAAGVIPSPAEGGARNPSSSALESQRANAQRDSSVGPAGPGLPRNDAAAQATPPAWLQPLLGDPKVGAEARALWEQQQAYRAIFPGGAREAQAMREMFPGGLREAQTLKEIFPGGAREAQEVAARANEFAAMDRAYFSGEARTQGELANWLLRDNPAAFRAMLQQGARVLAERDPGAFAEFASAFAELAPGSAEYSRAFAGAGRRADFIPGTEPRNAVIPSPAEGGARNPSSALVGQGNAQRDSSVVPAAPGLPRNDTQVPSPQRSEVDLLREQAQRARGSAPAEWAQLERARGELRAEQYAAFQQSANDAVVEHVRGSIAQTLASVLPANVPDAARQRLAEAVFHEINTTLQRDPALAEQVAAVARSWRFDAATRQQVVDLIARRARQMVAPVSKRVVGEWTAGLVGAHRARSQRIEQAAARVDLAGGGAPETVSRRALSPREVDYTALTDEQILSL